MGSKRLKIPYTLCGKDYSYTDDLYQAFLKNWDMAAAALKRGALAEYFKKLREIDPEQSNWWEMYYCAARNLQEDMWNDELHEDVVFAKFMYHFSRLHGSEVYTPMPMGDKDVSKSKLMFEEVRMAPEEGIGDHFLYRAYGSKTGNWTYKEDAYIDYMKEESWKAGLSRIEWNMDVIHHDLRKPDETAGQKPERVTMLDQLVTLDKVAWWQDYLEEIGEFE